MAYYVVDAPVWATFATNTLISATAPVNLLFNQTRLPSGTNGPGDFTLLAGSTGGFALLSSAGGTPPLVPGQRYYLGVQNTNTNAVTFSLAVSFDVTPLRDNVPVSGTIAATPMPRYFSFDVLPSAASVSFQLFNLSGDANLVASKSPTFPTLTAYDYGSFNPNTDNEDITITPFSNPLPLSPGRWLLGVFNNDVTNVNYTIVAKQTVEPGTNIVITGIQVTSTNLCLTWTSVSGDSYYVEGAVTVRDAVWTPVSPTIVATDSVTTYCVPLPSAYSFFRVRPGAAPNVPGGTVAIGKVTYTPAGVTIEWTAPVTSQFNVQWTQEVNPPVWTSFPETITSTTGTFFYLDDGSKTGGMGTVRFYRLLEL
jgi:hypothetical protein